MNRTEPEIQRADPALRRRAIALVIVVAAAGAAGVYSFEAWFRDVAQDPAMALRVSWAVILGAAAVPAFMAVYLFVMATRVRRAGVYPPPGLLLARDTVIYRGDRALRLAGWLTTAAVLLAAGAAAVPVMFFRLVRVLTGGA